VLPAVAARAIDTDTGLLMEVLDVRAFARAWDAQARYEADPEHVTSPTLPRALRERLLAAKYARLMDLKEARP
jgi:hypothetical protein